MGHRHSRDEILEGALACAFAEGLSQVTFGRVARHLGISDRMVVYYFPSKDDLLGDVLGALGARLQASLAPAFTSPADDHLALVRTAWPVLARPEADPVFALFFEAAGQAAAGREPYRTIVPALMEGWIAWAAEFVTGPPARRRTEAASAIAVLDGLLLVRHLVGAREAAAAARRLGVAPAR